MMSIAKVGTASGAARYYTRDNYYTGSEQAAESSWAGRGAARLGLVPDNRTVARTYKAPVAVETKAFEAVLDGRPSASVQIGHVDKAGEWQHQPGFDLTFLAPKSVSILALVGCDRRLIDAHRQAVAETLTLVEDRMIGVQENPKGGPKTTRPTQEGVFALFTHDLSRAHDPLLHTHAVVANATWDPLKESWRAIDGQALYANRRLISNAFDAVLRRKVEDLGYKTEMVGRYGAWEVPIGQAAIQLQSKRREAILERLGQSAGTADWNTRQDIARATRDAKRNPDRTALQRAHVEELKAVGFDARHYVERAASRKPRRRGRATARVAATQEGLLDRHIAHLLHTRTTFTPDRLLLSLSMDGAARFDPDRIETGLKARLESGALVAHSLDRDGRLRLTTPAMIVRETRILSYLEQGGQTAPLASEPDRLRSLVARLPERTTNDGQRALIEQVLLGRTRYHGVQGHAGTGKTSTLKALIALGIRTGAGPSLREDIFAMAPTHKALGALRSATGSDGDVTQQFVSDYRHLLKEGSEATAEERAAWSGRVVILDEASQVSYAHGEDLMRIFDALQPRKILLMGDRDQTNSVEAGNWFELLQDRGLPTETLREVVRQKGVEAEAPELLRAAQKVANGDTLGALYALKDRVHEAPVVASPASPERETTDPRDYIEQAARAAYASDVAGEDYILYAPTNSLREALNANFRDALRSDDRLAQDETLQALKPLYTSPAFMGAASSYRRGDVLHFGRAVARGTFEKDSLWSVINVNREKNILTLAPQGTPQELLKDQKQHWTLRPMARFPFSHLSARLVDVAVGDEIVFGMRDRTLAIGRGQNAVVTAISGSEVTFRRPETAEDRMPASADALREGGWGRVEPDAGGAHLELTLPRDHVQVQSLQHAYAFTTYTVQGQSRDSAYVAMQAQSDAVNRKSVGVSLTREERNLQVFTNDAKALRRNAVRTDDAALAVTGTAPEDFRAGYDPSAADFAEQARSMAEARTLAREAAATERVERADTLFDDRMQDRDGLAVDGATHDGPEDLFDVAWDRDMIPDDARQEARHDGDRDLWDSFDFGAEADRDAEDEAIVERAREADDVGVRDADAAQEAARGGEAR